MGDTLLESYPPALRRVPLIRAVCNAVGEEVALHDAMLDELERNVIASTAEEHLEIWESQVGLTVNPPGLSIAQRKSLLLAYLSIMTMTGSGADWKTTATLVLGTSGWTYKTNDPADLTSPPPHVINLYLPYAPGSLQATVATNLMRAITPAADQINVTYTQGLVLDASQLDDDLMG